MNPELKQRVARNVAWLGGLALVLIAIIGGSIYRLASHRSHVQSLESDIQRQREDLHRSQMDGDRALRLESLEAAVAEWGEMTGSESARIQELTSAARAAGVTLISLKSDELGNAEEGFVSRSHRVRGIGDYRQVGTFLGRIQEGRGMAAIDELKIAPEEDAGPGLLHASLRVTWHAPDTSRPDAAEEVQ